MIADDEHVRIVPVAGTCELTESVLQIQRIKNHCLCSLLYPIISVVVDDVEDLIPGVAHIIVVPPQVAVFCY